MGRFWEVELPILSAFIFVAYLLVVFQVVVDLFRDAELGGFSKVLWIIGLIFLPFLTALVYIIARADGMAKRQQAAAQRARADVDAYIREVAGSRLQTRLLAQRRCSTPARSTKKSTTGSRQRRLPRHLA
jgi:hypothetical protein